MGGKYSLPFFYLYRIIFYEPVDEYCVNPIFHIQKENAMKTRVVIGASPYQNGVPALPNIY